MTQDETVGVVAESVGYRLKQVTAALHAAMDKALRPLVLTVSQYSCLEILGQDPGLSNSDLARRVFVSRQAMNGVLQGLQNRGLVARPATASKGRTLPTELTAVGRRRLHQASVVVRAVEKQMLSNLSEQSQRRLRRDLVACMTALQS